MIVDVDVLQFAFQNGDRIFQPVLPHDVHGLVSDVGHVDADHVAGEAVTSAKHGQDAGAAAQVQNFFAFDGLGVELDRVAIRFRPDLIGQHVVVDAEMSVTAAVTFVSGFFQIADGFDLFRRSHFGVAFFKNSPGDVTHFVHVLQRHLKLLILQIQLPPENGDLVP